MLYRSTNPEAKKLAKRNKLKVKVMILCHTLANFRNNMITSVSKAIDSMVYRNGLSVNAINLLSKFWAFPEYTTILKNSKKIVENHEKNIGNHIENKKDNVIVLNIDDYHR